MRKLEVETVELSTKEREKQNKTLTGQKKNIKVAERANWGNFGNLVKHKMIRCVIQLFKST